MRDHPRQEPGAVIPPAGIRAGGGGSTAVPTATYQLPRKSPSTSSRPSFRGFVSPQ
jgi:hypothetical protein